MVDRKINAPLMIPISEKYKDMGTIIVGKVESGHVRKGDSLLLMPNKDVVEVGGIYNEMEEETDRGLCGDNVRIRIRGVDDEDISPGFVLTSPSKPVRAVRQFEAQLAILEHKSIICAGYSAVLHVHTLSEEVILSVSHHTYCHYSSFNLLVCSPCSTTSIRQLVANPRDLPNSPRRVLLSLQHTLVMNLTPSSLGQKIIALIETTAPICIEKFTDYPQLGRFTLRDEGTPALFSLPLAPVADTHTPRSNDCHWKSNEAHREFND